MTDGLTTLTNPAGGAELQHNAAAPLIRARKRGVTAILEFKEWDAFVDVAHALNLKPSALAARCLRSVIVTGTP